jgi:hypothetical protein
LIIARLPNRITRLQKLPPQQIKVVLHKKINHLDLKQKQNGEFESGFGGGVFGGSSHILL